MIKNAKSACMPMPMKMTFHCMFLRCSLKINATKRINAIPIKPLNMETIDKSIYLINVFLYMYVFPSLESFRIGIS